MLIVEARRFNGLDVPANPLKQGGQRPDIQCRWYNFCDLPHLSIPYRV
jgi:hypothetical protein